MVDKQETHAMKIKQLSNLSEYVGLPMWDVDRMIYRGVTDERFELVPAIGRLRPERPDDLRRFEQAVLTDFQRRSLPFLKNPPQTTLSWMFLAQHYGVPTRLLDWTTNPLIALYFAVTSEGHADASFAVYRLVQNTWLDDIGGESPFELEDVCAVMPPHFDVRLANQDGLFTIHPDPRVPYTSGEVEKFVFPASMRDQIRRELRKMGYGPARAYPGLEGVAKEVVERQRYLLNRGAIPGSGVLEILRP